jgi:2-oxoglutarate ferredoxin oxidoreductase subunit gamma
MGEIRMTSIDPLKIIVGGGAGQGAATAGILLAEAAVLGGLYPTQTSFTGAAVRSGDSEAHVIISRSFVDYPFVETPNVLIALSQSAADRYAASLKDGGAIFYDPDFINAAAKPGCTQVPIRAVAALVQADLPPQNLNLFWLGAYVAMSDVVLPHLLTEAIRVHFPNAVFSKNNGALFLGIELAHQLQGATGP